MSSGGLSERGECHIQAGTEGTCGGGGGGRVRENSGYRALGKGVAFKDPEVAWAQRVEEELEGLQLCLGDGPREPGGSQGRMHGPGQWEAGSLGLFSALLPSYPAACHSGCCMLPEALSGLFTELTNSSPGCVGSYVLTK